MEEKPIILLLTSQLERPRRKLWPPANKMWDPAITLVYHGRSYGRVSEQNVECDMSHPFQQPQTLTLA